MISSLYKYFLIWLLFIPVPVINGIIREKFYSQAFGEVRANQISTVILSLLFFLYVYLLLKNTIGSLTFTDAMILGGSWVLLTIIFELLFGHFVDKATWQKLIDKYNIFRGNWWSLFLLFELIAPLLVKLLS